MPLYIYTLGQRAVLFKYRAVYIYPLSLPRTVEYLVFIFITGLRKPQTLSKKRKKSMWLIISHTPSDISYEIYDRLNSKDTYLMQINDSSILDPDMVPS